MKGVMDACVSAGSNQVGASETWTPKVNWPPGMAAKAAPGPAATAPKATTVSTSRRVSRVSLANESELLSEWDEVAMYAPLRSSSLRRIFRQHTLPTPKCLAFTPHCRDRERPLGVGGGSRRTRPNAGGVLRTVVRTDFASLTNRPALRRVWSDLRRQP